ncbi:MAG: FAD-binding protein, partial [Clostridia bacterium]
MDQNSISRRDFLRKAAGVAVGVAGMGVLGTCLTADKAIAEKETVTSGQVVNMPTSWDDEADLVTIGTGVSLYGVIKAASEGLKVIAIDAAPTAGGSAGFSGGVLWLPNNPKARELGDTREKAFAYIKDANGSANFNEEIVNAFLDNIDPMLGFIDPLLQSTSEHLAYLASPNLGDYHPHWKDGMEFGRSVDWRLDGKPDGGYNVVKLRKAILELCDKTGVIMMTSTKATKFVYRYNVEGVPEVLGVICEKDGKEIAIKANKAVLYAPGGFEWNMEMQKDFCAIPGCYPTSISTNDGTGFKMVSALAPMMTNLANHFGHLCYEERAKEQIAKMAPANMVFERHRAHTIMVNAHGKRFFNESCDYPTAQKQFYTPTSYGDNGRAMMPCWLVADGQFLTQSGFNPKFCGDLDEQGIPLFFVKADTLEELAEKMGVDKANFIAEVKRFNGFCDKGHDDDFTRGD